MAEIEKPLPLSCGCSVSDTPDAGLVSISMMTRYVPATWLMSLVICLTVGCHHAGTIPPGWRGEPISLSGDEQAEHVGSARTGQGNGGGSQGLLQVFICYGKVLSNHTAVRLGTPGKETLMWDPGGTYGQYDPSYARRHDVLTKNAPTVDQWWRYRRDRCREPIMEVFQWSIDADQARRLHAVLLNYHDPADTAQTFEPDTGGLQCCTKVSEYLMRFADGRPAVPGKLFWPHELGEHLWTQEPDSVMVFRSDGESDVYRRDTGSGVTK